MREWTYVDTLWVGLALIIFRNYTSRVIILIWKFFHPKSLNKLNNWLIKRSRTKGGAM